MIIFNQLTNQVVGQGKDRLSGLLELLCFIVADVAKLAFREAVDEKCLVTFAKNHNAAVTLGIVNPGGDYAEDVQLLALPRVDGGESCKGC